MTERRVVKMKRQFRIYFIGMLAIFIVIGFIGVKDVCSKHDVPAIAQEVMGMTKDLCDIAGYGVNAGIHPGPKGDAAANYILGKLHKAGLMQAKLEPILVNNPFPTNYGVTVTVQGQPSQSLKCFPFQYTATTPPAGITGQLAYVGDGSASYFQRVSVAGKIALIDEKMIRGFIASATEGMNRARDNGAIAVFRVSETVESPQMQKGGCRHNGGSPAPTCIYQIPVFYFGKSEGDYLRNLAKSGTPHTVKMVFEAPLNVLPASNVVFELPGNGSKNEVILVGTHYDSGMFTGAVDNNCSVALMIKWAEYFARQPKKDRDRDMIFAWNFGHDFDQNSGHYQFAEAHKEQLKNAIVWDVDHACGGTRWMFDEAQGKIVPTDETAEFYIISNNYTFTRLAAFTMDKYNFVCTQNQFGSSGSGPQWGMAPTTSPWVNVATIPLYYHSTLDTPDKITLDQVERAYPAHIEIVENIARTPEGFLKYDNIDKTRENTAPEVRIALLSNVVSVGDVVMAWNDETFFYDDKTAYHYPGVPYWAGTVWDWGDGTKTTGGPNVNHTYASPGTFTVKMTFTDTEGAATTATRQVVVLP
jgi:hypothetical protein